MRTRSFEWKYLARLKVWIILYCHFVSPEIYLKYSVWSLQFIKWNGTIRSWVSLWRYWHYIVFIYPWVVLIQSTFFQWWRHNNRALLLAGKGIPKLRTAPSWLNFVPAGLVQHIPRIIPSDEYRIRNKENDIVWFCELHFINVHILY